jgi:hypothetical protein
MYQLCAIFASSARFVVQKSNRYERRCAVVEHRIRAAVEDDTVRGSVTQVDDGGSAQQRVGSVPAM